MTRVSLAGEAGLSNAQRVRAHCPELLDSLNVYYEQLWRSDRVDASIKELVRMRCATVNECRY